MRDKRKGIEPSAPIPPANDKPLIDRRELERSECTLREYTLSEDERLAIIEKYGPPTRKLHSYVDITSHKRVRPSLSGRR